MTVLDRILSGEFVNPDTLFGVVFYALLFLGFVWLGIRSLRLTLERMGGRLLDPTTAKFLHRMGNALIWAMALILYAHLIPELRSLGTALLTGVSVASILIGLAAQSTLGNFIAGLSLLLYRPFQIGDLVQLTVPSGVQIGTIEDLTLGYTVIKTPENHEIVVPNSVMASQAIIKSVAESIEV
jgi:small-conductance mechanosensitive channel